MAARRPAPRKPRSNGGASRKKSGGAPGWVWLVTGLLIGLFIAFLVFIAPLKSPSPSAEKEKPKSTASDTKTPENNKPADNKSKSTNTASGAKPKNTEGPKEKKSAATAKPATPEKSTTEPKKPAVNYDFYKILPQYEVVVPEDDGSKPANTTTPPGIYYLQVGAFRHVKEADGRKAELAMLGIVSSIQTVTIEAGNTWHRVRIGPVRDMRQLDRTKRQLQDNNITFVTLKEKS